MDMRERREWKALADVLVGRWMSTEPDLKEKIAQEIVEIESPTRAALVVAMMGATISNYDMAELVHEIAAQIR